MSRENEREDRGTVSSRTESRRGHFNRLLDEQEEFTRELNDKEREERERSRREFISNKQSISRVDGDDFTRRVGLGVREGIRGKGTTWEAIRNNYMVGDREQLADGTWISHPVSLRELSRRHNLGYNNLCIRAKSEGWSKYRDAYLTRLREKNLETELDFYTQENFTSEVKTMNSVQKLGDVLETYIEVKYGKILEASRELDGVDITEDEDIKTEFSRVNNNTGISVFINELQQAVKVADSIYSLQRKVYENIPTGVSDVDLSEVVQRNSKKKDSIFRTESERQSRLEKLRKDIILQETSKGIYTRVDIVTDEEE